MPRPKKLLGPCAGRVILCLSHRPPARPPIRAVAAVPMHGGSSSARADAQKLARRGSAPRWNRRQMPLPWHPARVDRSPTYSPSTMQQPPGIAPTTLEPAGVSDRRALQPMAIPCATTPRHAKHLPWRVSKACSEPRDAERPSHMGVNYQNTFQRDVAMIRDNTVLW